MKRTPIRKISKQGRINIKASKYIRENGRRMGLPNRCEAQIDENCHGGMFLTVAHRHKRSWYYKCPEKLTDIKQIAIFCVYCHDYLEHRREKHEEVFMRLRGEESA